MHYSESFGVRGAIRATAFSWKIRPRSFSYRPGPDGPDSPRGHPFISLGGFDRRALSSGTGEGTSAQEVRYKMKLSGDACRKTAHNIEATFPPRKRSCGSSPGVTLYSEARGGFTWRYRSYCHSAQTVQRNCRTRSWPAVRPGPVTAPHAPGLADFYRRLLYGRTFAGKHI